MADLPESELEKVLFSKTQKSRQQRTLMHFQAVDKVGRTARRTMETHIKNAFSKPRVATAVRRMAALLNFVPDLRKCRYQSIPSLK